MSDLRALLTGIEWYTLQDAMRNAEGKLEDFTDEGCMCARCGSSCAFANCWHCGGDGFTEDVDDCNMDEYEVTCSICKGKGGWHRCISSPEWCNANPMPGRDHIQSTALKPEEWE